MPGMLRPGEGDAAIDHQPFALALAGRSRKGRDSCRFRRDLRAAQRRVRHLPRSSAFKTFLVFYDAMASESIDS